MVDDICYRAPVPPESNNYSHNKIISKFMKISVRWHVTLCSLVFRYGCR